MRSQDPILPFVRRVAPSLTLPLVLNAVTVAVLAMWVDRVPVFSRAAYGTGIALAAGLSVVVGTVLARQRGSSRVLAALLLPTLFGAMIGMAIQAIVLGSLGIDGAFLRDLGGHIRTVEPIGWILGGVVLGGGPALLLAGFLLVGGRILRRFTGHDAGEAVKVVFGGTAGLVAAIGLHVVDLSIARAPLVVVIAIAELMVVLALAADTARIRFLRQVYAGANDFDVVPASRFGADPGLTALVANAGSAAVLVRRLPPALYRAAAGEPVGFVADTEKETLAPLLRRRTRAAVLLALLAIIAGSSTLPAWLF